MAKYLDDKGLKTFTTKMKGYADGKVSAVDKKVTPHINNKSNPHSVTKEQVGLDKVDNVKQIPWSQRGTVNGVATLDAKGKVPITQMPETKQINGQSIFESGNITVSTSLYKIVDALPTKDIDITKIYLVPTTATAAKNNKTEYIYIGDPNKAYDESKWEKLGDEQKNTPIGTPGGTIIVDTALIENSSNPVAGGVVKAKVDEIDRKLADKVESSTYNTEIGTINSTLEDLKKKETITVDSELKSDSTNPVQNKVVKKAVDDLDTKINNKANSTDLTTANGRIETLESKSLSIDDITLIPVTDGNGIASITKSNKKLVITQGKFVTSLAGYATTSAMNTALAGKSDTGHIHTQYALKTALDDYVKNTALTAELNKKADKEHTHSQYALASAIPTKTSQLNNDSGFLTAHQSLDGYVNNVKTTEVTNGNGIASISKSGNVLNVTQGTFVTKESLKGYWNTLYIDERDGNGIADIWVDIHNRSELCVNKRKFVTPEILDDSIEEYASKQKYLKEENMKETVVIKLVSDKSESDTNLNGATVTVKSGDTTVSTQTWQGSPISVEVPCGEEVTVEVPKKQGYKVNTTVSFYPIPLNKRNVIITYKALSLGCFILDKDDNLIDGSLWDPATGNAVGVALITEKVAIVIATGRHTDGLAWSTESQLVEGVVATTDITEAFKDYNGKANTEVIVRALDTKAPSAYYCYNYTFKNGKKGYLMSAGEAREIYTNAETIANLLSTINPSTSNLMVDDELMTSTQYNDSWFWCVRNGSASQLPKSTDNLSLFPIYSLYD